MQEFRRVDVFSVSGGVGKTLLAVRLAQLQAQRRRAPVLVVDADIGGPCLGDLLESWASPPWDSTENLLHLICGRPEYLPEQLRPGKLPVYRMRDECPPAEARAPELATSAVRGAPAVLFCPSHPHSTNPRVETAVVHALLGHESAGGWIGEVIKQVIRATHELAGRALGGVIVDHSTSLGALQVATLRACLASSPDAGRYALMVTTPRAADLAAARDLYGRILSVAAELSPATAGPPTSSGSRARDAEARIQWIVNRVPIEQTGDWQERIRKAYPRNDGWLANALPVRVDPATAASQAVAALPADRRAALDADVEKIRAQVFG